MRRRNAHHSLSIENASGCICYARLTEATEDAATEAHASFDEGRLAYNKREAIQDDKGAVGLRMDYSQFERDGWVKLLPGQGEEVTSPTPEALLSIVIENSSHGVIAEPIEVLHYPEGISVVKEPTPFKSSDVLEYDINHPFAAEMPFLIQSAVDGRVLACQDVTAAGGATGLVMEPPEDGKSRQQWRKVCDHQLKFGEEVFRWFRVGTPTTL
ncbi:unnamed protein product [Vitrella brassicaformis CCMP3155]|uniref:Uncharacterized protein n=1 Tax=Vitrella brassicaformis (strain CCMP3155) TaxID=1169540 RepID=A0A0G4G6N2_VITBC|nr:unnamed protein product [Vitrella brassicaformis CCMP3155]|eukprot:CEM24131.1 unnamed protein product [Vitrella brassicaformis CCMP3155]